ncbi:MAG: hypothetical protein IPJ89_05185 [Candidatus Iainarchaeum archaeon]|uniref:SD-repeat containing protein B domain-containing protein n=1 Tax=Candidatus Iainarchaeum sp. TaxID=3101447 RepID=A0A7T9I1X8_9ARCH|nr:MAG: hypothetical protein IPJ89_05185 [Candidatus Diapherotrites archaeon]
MQGEDFILHEGFHANLSDSSGNAKNFTYYNIQYGKSDTEIVPFLDTIVKIDDVVLHPAGESYFNFHPTTNEKEPAPRKQALTRYEENVEILFQFDESGNIDFSKSSMATVPEKYSEGIDVEDGKRTIVCYDTASADISKTQLCDYYQFNSYEFVSEVREEDIEIARERFSHFNEPKKGLPSYLTDGSEYIDRTDVVEGAVIPRPTIDSLDIPEQWRPQIKEKELGQLPVDANQEVSEVVPPSDEGKVVEADIVVEEKPLESVSTDANFAPLKPRNFPLFFTPERKIELQATSTVFSEGFEGSNFPSNWSRGDADSTSGADYWDINSSVAHNGSKSAWSAQVGSQDIIVYQYGFESTSPLTNWLVYDLDTTAPQGQDYWGVINNSSFADSGSKSAFCAVNYNGSTSNTANYDNRMLAYLENTTVYNATNWSNVKVSYRVKYNTETNVDFIRLAVYDANSNTWQVVNSDTGSSGGIYVTRNVNIPSSLYTSTFAIAFVFTSDVSITNIGAYIDNITITRTANNTAVGNYDNDMESYMTTPSISLSSIFSEQLKFWVKSQVETSFDYYKVEASPNSSFSSPTLLFTDGLDYSSWTQKIVNLDTLPFNPIYLRFTFSSDGSNHNFSGTFIDDISVTGNNLLSNGSVCSSSNQCVSGICNANNFCGLANGASCTSGSQCQINVCTNNICGTGAAVGANCSNDSDCSSNYCSFTSSSQATCASASSNPVYNVFDSWDSSNSGGNSVDTDHIAFVNESVKPTIVNLKQNTDMLCYDFDSDGTYDACYYDTVNGCNGGSCSATSCNNESIPNSVPSNKKWGCDIDSFNGCVIGNGSIPAQICSGGSCSVSTSSPKTDEMTVKAFYDCDNSSNAQSSQTVPTPNGSENDYAIVSPKYYVCDYSTTPDPGYAFRGKTGNLTSDWVEGFLYSCPANNSCSPALDEQSSITGNASLANPCKKNVGQSCSSNSECLYNVCSSNTCQQGMILDGSLRDQAFVPLSNTTVKLYTCSDSLVATTTTNSLGKYAFTLPSGGSYRTKFTTSWGEYVATPTGSNSSCVSYPSGLNAWNWWINTSTTVTGTAVTPSGFPSVGLNFSLNTCSNSQLDTDSTNSLGQFSLNGPAGYQKLKVSIGGNWVDVAPPSGNACILNYGNVDYGQLELTSNCSLYNNTCNGDNRLYNCQANSNGCGCAIQQCQAGCTEGAPQCNAVGTGTIRVTATKNNDPIVNASVFINNQSVGKTNGFGKKEVARPHGNYSVKVVCPGSSGIQAETTAYLNGNSKNVSLTPNCPVLQKGNLKVLARDNQGFPVANIYVFIDEDNSPRAITDLTGIGLIEGLEYGQHDITLAFKQDENAAPVQITTITTISSTSTDLNHTIIFSGQYGYSATAFGGNAELIAVPVAIINFLVIEPGVELGRAVDEYCSCLYPATAQLPKLGQCIADFAVCPTTNLITANNSHCVNWQLSHYDAGGICKDKFIPAAGGVALTVAGDKIIGVVGKGAGRLAETRVAKEIGSVVGNSSSQILAKFNQVQVLQRIENVGIKFTYGQRGYISPFISNKIRKAVIDLGLNNAQLTDDGATAAYNFVKGVESWYGHPPAVAQNLAKNITIFGPDNPTELFNAIGKLQAAGKNVGFTVNGELVTVATNSKVGNIIQNISAVENSGRIGNIQGATSEIVSAANKYFNEFVEFVTDGLGDLKLTGNRRVEIKAKDLTGINDRELLIGVRQVRDGAEQMVDIVNAIPAPSNGKHLFQFPTVAPDQRGWILDYIAQLKGVPRSSIEQVVDVVGYV